MDPSENWCDLSNHHPVGLISSVELLEMHGGVHLSVCAQGWGSEVTNCLADRNGMLCVGSAKG
jgi:hypothetical protein